MNRIIQALAFVAGAVGLVWIGWPGASTNSATPVNRMYVVGTLVLLAGLPPLVRRYFGPARPGWAPLVTRVGGYAVVLALIAVTAVQQRISSQLGGYFPVILPVWAMDVGFLLIIAGYVAGLLILTCRRVQFTRRVLPLALGIGALTAGVLYSLAPFGISAMAEAASHSMHGGPVVVADYLAGLLYTGRADRTGGRARRGHPAGRPRHPARPAHLDPAGPAGHRRRHVDRGHPGSAIHLDHDRVATPPGAATARGRHLPYLRSKHHRDPGEPAPGVLLRGERRRCRRRHVSVVVRAARRRRLGRLTRSLPLLLTARHPTRWTAENLIRAAHAA
jgi:hypothetical protein